MNLNSFLLKNELENKNSSPSSRERDVLTHYLKQGTAKSTVAATVPGLSVNMGPVGATNLTSSAVTPSPLVVNSTSAPLPLSSYGGIQIQEFLPTIISLTGRMLQELDTNTGRLLTLNRSRKEKIAYHLWRLAGTRPAGAESENPLKYWIEGSKSTLQEEALKTYLEEVALTYVGQCVLLRIWSACGHRKWSEKDLGDLNWTLTQALKSYHPVDRDGWQIIRPNIYSWYSPSSAIQKEIFHALDLWDLSSGFAGPSTESTDFIPTLLKGAQQSSARRKDAVGIDFRFYIALWKKITELGFDPEPEESHLRRRKVVYTPTLRDGQMMRFAPSQMTWVGMESYPFLLVQAELSQLSKGPSAPQLWALGFGIENHSRDQLSFGLNHHRIAAGLNTALGGGMGSATMAKITDLESCDFSIVLEESCIRLGNRSQEAHLLREQLESLDYFKRLKTASTSLGLLQTCVALTKLRPGSMLLWARAEPLRASEGKEALRFLLERAQLIGEWNYSELHHQLPSESPLYPNYLYLFRREPNLQARLEHRPQRFVVRGQIRSHIEVPLALEDSFSMRETSRSGWTVKPFGSSSPQREWMEDWPEAACPVKLRQFESVWKTSAPLGSWARILPTPEPDAPALPMAALGQSPGHAESGTWTLYGKSNGFWVKPLSVGQGGASASQRARKLCAKPLPFGESQRVSGSGFLVILPQAHWSPVLSHFLESPLVSDYLEHHAEKKSDKWNLKEANIRMIPVAKEILQNLGAAIGDFQSENDHTGNSASPPLGTSSNAGFSGRKIGDAELESTALDLTFRTKLEPKRVLEQLKNLQQGASPLEQKRQIASRVYIAATSALQPTREQIKLLSRMIREEKSSGGLAPAWREILSVLARSECLPASYHEQIHIQGSLPSHVPIIEIRRVQHPAPGVLFATESGFHLTMASSEPLLIEMLFDQLQGVQSPTWSELSQFIKLPKKTEVARVTANEFLGDFQRLKHLENDLLQLADACLECLHLPEADRA